jgi:hypothetical protein
MVDRDHLVPEGFQVEGQVAVAAPDVEHPAAWARAMQERTQFLPEKLLEVIQVRQCIVGIPGKINRPDARFRARQGLVETGVHPHHHRRWAAVLCP